MTRYLRLILLLFTCASFRVSAQTTTPGTGDTPGGGTGGCPAGQVRGGDGLCHDAGPPPPGSGCAADNFAAYQYASDQLVQGNSLRPPGSTIAGSVSPGYITPYEVTVGCDWDFTGVTSLPRFYANGRSVYHVSDTTWTVGGLRPGGSYTFDVWLGAAASYTLSVNGVAVGSAIVVPTSAVRQATYTVLADSAGTLALHLGSTSGIIGYLGFAVHPNVMAAQPPQFRYVTTTVSGNAPIPQQQGSQQSQFGPDNSTVSISPGKVRDHRISSITFTAVGPGRFATPHVATWTLDPVGNFVDTPTFVAFPNGPGPNAIFRGVSQNPNGPAYQRRDPDGSYSDWQTGVGNGYMDTPYISTTCQDSGMIPGAYELTVQADDGEVLYHLSYALSYTQGCTSGDVITDPGPPDGCPPGMHKNSAGVCVPDDDDGGGDCATCECISQGFAAGLADFIPELIRALREMLTSLMTVLFVPSHTEANKLFGHIETDAQGHKTQRIGTLGQFSHWGPFGFVEQFEQFKQLQTNPEKVVAKMPVVLTNSFGPGAHNTTHFDAWTTDESMHTQVEAHTVDPVSEGVIVLPDVPINFSFVTRFSTWPWVRGIMGLGVYMQFALWILRAIRPNLST